MPGTGRAEGLAAGIATGLGRRTSCAGLGRRSSWPEDRPYTVECSRSVRTPPPVSSSTIRSPAGLRTAAPQSGQVKE
ncbi:hypothetical protein GCM10009535_07170 [Streptomyces thermocarboxydovorans]|uniref:Uncharacterized protein n=1 Tax=Streptomyces thermocarboxydovorans TaxID=59298 RepID=A0ABN1H975_9ACTN